MEDYPDIDHLAKLCRIKITEKEKLKLQSNLQKVLEYMQLLDEVDTTGVQPATHVLETLANVMDEDEPRAKTMTREDFLKNAPDQVGGMIKVPPVIQFEE